MHLAQDFTTQELGDLEDIDIGSTSNEPLFDGLRESGDVTVERILKGGRCEGGCE